ncbi:MAG: hypothetical protein IKX14_01225 [Neisseriaceae bacterium]|nr:hypothetical protein [Neisseriaceae bacterium]
MSSYFVLPYQAKRIIFRTDDHIGSSLQVGFRLPERNPAKLISETKDTTP